MNEMVILAVGAHPDDVEIGMGGTIFSHVEQGDTVYICNLTKGELSSNGTVDSRQQEATEAARILQITGRYQLHFPDRGISRDHKEYTALIDLIRTLQPDVIFAPFYEDRHPDHGACSRLVKEAVFDAGIRKFPEVERPAHKVADVFYYFINGFSVPDFYIDIAPYQSIKERALCAYESQFVKKNGSVSTPLTDRYIESVRSRDSLFGKEAGVLYAEGFKQASSLVFSSIPKRRTL